MDEKKLKPYADITVVTGKYMKEGKERNRYHKIGTLFASPHFSNMTIKLDSMPLNDGWLKVFPRDDATQQPKDEVVELTDKDIKDGVSLDDIPF